MAMKILTDLCTSCGDCEPECPTASISVKKGLYIINANECTECEGDFSQAAMREDVPDQGLHHSSISKNPLTCSTGERLIQRGIPL